MAARSYSQELLWGEGGRSPDRICGYIRHPCYIEGGFLGDHSSANSPRSKLALLAAKRAKVLATQPALKGLFHLFSLPVQCCISLPLGGSRRVPVPSCSAR